MKDFAARSEFSDWFSREDDAPKAPVVMKPNPRNMELDEKLAQLEINIKRYIYLGNRLDSRLTSFVDYKMRRERGKQYGNLHRNNHLFSLKTRSDLLFCPTLISWTRKKAKSEASLQTRKHRSILLGYRQNQDCAVFSRHSSFRLTNLPITFTSSSSGLWSRARKRIRFSM